MTDTIGRGVIELSADSSGLNAAIDKARKSIAGLGDSSKAASDRSAKSIDNHIKRLKDENAQLGMNAREIQAYRLASRGASNEQLRTADSILAATERYKASQTAVANLKSGFIAASAGALVAGTAFVTAMKGAIDYADELGDLSKKTGISVEDLSGLSLAARQSGTDLNGVADSINKLSQNIGKDGEKFRALGITAKEPIEAFKQLADIFAAVEDPQKRAALGAAALGKSWQSAAPLLAEGGEAIGKMVDKGKELSGITKELTEEADKFNDELEVLKTRAGGAANMIAGPLLKALNQMIADMAEGTKIAGGFGNALMTFGFSSPIGTAAEQVKKYSDELRGLEDSLARYKKAGSDTRAIDEAMIKTKQQLQFAQSRANKEAMEAGYRGKGFEDPRILKDPVDTTKVDEFIKEPKEAREPKAPKVNDEARAQLAFDLDQIKKATEAEVSIYANAEKIMEAKRAAGLIDDREYYSEKLSYILLNSQAQEAELLKEIGRLETEKALGRDSLDNERKIIDAQAKLAKVRADASTNVQVLSIQEKDYFDRIKKGYVEAEAAAQDYLNTVRGQYNRDLAGIGLGQKNRARNDGLAQIEDRYAQQLQKLASDKRQGFFDGRDADYEEELDRIKRFQAAAIESFADYYDRLDKAGRNWANGASEALANYYDQSRDIAKLTEEAFTNAFGGLEDALVEFTQTGKLDFKSLINSINADIARIAIKESITGPLAGFLKDAIGGKADAIAAPVNGGFIEQTMAANASTIALNALAAAASSSAAALSGGRPLQITPGSKQVIPPMGDFTRADRAMGGDAEQLNLVADAQQQGADSALEFGKTATSAAADITRLAQAAGMGGGALSQLPGIINIISAMAASSGASGGGGGGAGGLIGSLISAGMSYFGAPSLGVETVASGAVSADFKEMPNFLRGGRAIGGPVSAGGLYRVNENGPELLEVAGKEYLMMGNQGGKVEANPQMGGGGAVYNLAVNVTPPPGSNAATANQWGAMAGRQMQTALRRNG